MKKIFIFLFFTLCQQVSIAATNLETAIDKFQNLLLSSKSLSPELKKLQAQQNSSKFSLIHAYQNQLPHVQLDIKKTKDFYENNSALMQSLGLTKNDYSYGLSYQWELLNYALINQTFKEHTDKNLSQIEYENVQKEFDIKFTASFLKIILAKYKIATLENSIKKAETSLKEVSLGFQLGHKTKIDVLRSEANTVSLKSKRSLYREEEVNQTNQFLTFSGLNISDLIFLENLEENQLIQFIESKTKVENFSRGNVEKSPLIKKIDLEIKSQKQAASLITKDEFPRLYLQGSYTNSSDTWSNTLHRPKRAHSVALVLSIPLFSSGTLITSSFEEYFQKKQIEYIKTQNRFELSNKLETAHIKILTLKETLDSIRLNVEQYEELFKLTLKSYQLGKSSLYELLDVQDNLFNSKVQLAEARINLFEMALNYQWQIGNNP